MKAFSRKQTDRPMQEKDEKVRVVLDSGRGNASETAAFFLWILRPEEQLLKTYPSTPTFPAWKRKASEVDQGDALRSDLASCKPRA